VPLDQISQIWGVTGIYCFAMHLSIKLCANNFAKSGEMTFFQNLIWQPLPYSIFTVSEFGKFPQNYSWVLELCTTSYTAQDQCSSVHDVLLMTSHKLTLVSIIQDGSHRPSQLFKLNEWMTRQKRAGQKRTNNCAQTKTRDNNA